MIIIALSDIHGRLNDLPLIEPQLRKADVVLVAGDITHFGRSETASEIISPLKDMSKRLFAVAGNCDYPEVDEYLKTSGVSLHARHSFVEDIAFIGMSGSLSCPGKTPNEYEETDFENFLARAVENLHEDLPLIVLSHQPAYGSLVDQVQNGSHSGSQALRSFVLNRKPLLCVSGHIHEAQGVDTMGSACMVNPGPFRYGSYAYIELSDRVETVELRSIKE